jgi:lysine-specific demethylase 3
MYNAFEGKETAGGQGSYVKSPFLSEACELTARTRLHMDVADAINIMLYASPRSDGQPGCAVWDLFRAQDADTIRAFLQEKFGGKVYFEDPIHSQVFYLDSALRKELADEYGVVGFRVYQYPVSPFLSRKSLVADG